MTQILRRLVALFLLLLAIPARAAPPPTVAILPMTSHGERKPDVSPFWSEARRALYKRGPGRAPFKPTDLRKLEATIRSELEKGFRSRGFAVLPLTRTKAALTKAHDPGLGFQEQAVAVGTQLKARYVVLIAEHWSEPWETLDAWLCGVEEGTCARRLTRSENDALAAMLKALRGELSSLLWDLPGPRGAVRRPPLPPVTTSVDPVTRYEWVHLPGGAFPSGCLEHETSCFPSERERSTTATVGAFALGRFEVTAGEYRACVERGACENEPLVEQVQLMATLPVISVTPKQASAFCRTVGGRLPTRLEWEYAARSGRDHVYPWGNALPSARRANFCNGACRSTTPSPLTDDGFVGPAPVGSFPAGATPWGIHDLVGNVAEFVSLVGTSGEVGVTGGGCQGYVADDLRISSFEPVKHTTASNVVGFRCARSVP